jgi:hypothetical protein
MNIQRSFQKADKVVEEFYDDKIDEGQNRRSANKNVNDAESQSVQQLDQVSAHKRGGATDSKRRSRSQVG